MNYVPKHHLDGGSQHLLTIQTIIIKKPITYKEARKLANKFTKRKFYREKENAFHFRNLPPKYFEKKSFRTKVINDKISVIFGQLKPDYGHLHGGWIWDSIKSTFNKAKDAVVDFFKPNLTGYNNRSSSTLKQYGNKEIKDIYLMRTPIKSFIHTALNFISLGKWDEVKAKYGYDKLFHLGMIVEVEGGKKIIVEKNEVVNISTSFKHSSDTETLDIPLMGKQITLYNLLEQARNTYGNDKFFVYDAFGGKNCQNFITDILSANGLLTSEAHKWLFQPIDELVKELPGYLPAIAKATTDVAATFNKITGGKQDKFLNQLKQLNISQKKYLSMAKKAAKKTGYDPSKLSFAMNNDNKLVYESPDGKKYFGKAGYGDYIIYTLTNKELADKKRYVFHASHGEMSKKYNLGKYSPNELSLNIIW